MQPSQAQFRYRSIKYSTSSFSLPSHPHPNNNPSPNSRLSLASQTASTPQLLLKPPQKTVGTKEKQKEKENRWSPIHPSRPPSSHYKLRIVANSSHLRTRCSEAGQEKPVSVATEIKEDQDCLILPASSGHPAFEPCIALLQENIDSLPPLLEQQRKQTQRIQQAISDIRRQAEAQLLEGQSQIQSKLQKLRSQIRIAFKEHSKQIINTRDAVSHLRNDLRTLSSFASQVEKDTAHQESTLYGPS